MSIDKHPLTRIFLVRHGETDANTAGKFEGQGGDSPLNHNGHQQAQSLALRFTDHKIDTIYTSELTRTKQTAQYTAEAHGSSVISNPMINEINIGIWEGLTLSEIADLYPDMYNKWAEDYTSIIIPEAESFSDLFQRSIDFLKEIVKLHSGEDIMVISHGGPIKCMLGSIQSMPLDKMMYVDIYNTGVSNIEYDNPDYRLSIINDIAHLDGLKPLMM